MSFAIDIENNRVQQSLRLLGIQEDDLMMRTFDDFVKKDTPEHIQRLRYSYHVKKQEDLVKLIKNHIKETILREIQVKSSKNKKSVLGNKPTHKTSATPDPVDRLSRIKEKHQEKIEQTLKNLQESFTGLQALKKKLDEGESLRVKLRNENLNKFVKNQEYKEKQQENLSLLKKNERNRWRSKRNLSNITPRLSTSKKLSSRQSLSAESSKSNDEIQRFLEKYNEKMKKSQLVYQQHIENKRKIASDLSQKAENTCKAMKQGAKLENEDTFFRMVTKHKEAERKRKEIQEQRLETLERLKQSTQQKREKANLRLQEYEKHLKKKARAIEARSEIYSKIQEQKAFNWTRKLELKHEFKRLKDEEISFNAERKKRML
jgi:hypothetical protein